MSNILGNRLLKSLGAASALSIAVGAGLAGAQAAELKVMFQGDPYEITVITDVAKRFEAANPGTTVQLINTPHDAYNEKIGAAVSAGSLPDILQLDAPFLANYVWSGFLQPVGGLLDKALVDDMTASNVAQGTYPIDKELYAIGLTDSTVALYGSRKQLEELKIRIPTSVEDAWTREEFEAALKTLSTAPGVKWPLDLFRSYGTKTEWITYAYEPILVSMGCDVIDRTNWKATGTLDGKACVDAATEMQGWVKQGWVVPQSAGQNQFYAEGRPAALAWGGHWFYAEASAKMGDDVVVMPLPKFGEKGVSPNGTWIWSVAKTASDPAAAGKFLSFMLQDPAYRDAYKAHAGFPGLKSFAAASPLYADKGAMAVAFEQAGKSAVARPPHPAYPTITLAFQNAMTNIFDGADPQAELSKAAKKIDDDILDNDGYEPFGKAE
ncbi:ABC transporter substrate-binding protein [Kaistia nematophila]|uniref:Sugar ABC transporter substrate-binding protein n=1 Tax=Kaistia nematophila TaxID=2994654 RepID=A0A9X3E2Q5_9HYPH|nr:sugar ABC transporter substrate-binding protein [Kaistia nematophila]MCX5570121.1 sugar ABC transporter substrate-binding protein [Kaistia nematophila]